MLQVADGNQSSPGLGQPICLHHGHRDGPVPRACVLSLQRTSEVTRLVPSRCSSDMTRGATILQWRLHGTPAWVSCPGQKHRGQCPPH